MATQTLSQILTGHGQAFLRDAPEAPQSNGHANVKTDTAFGEPTMEPPPPFEAPTKAVSVASQAHPTAAAPTHADGGLAPPMQHPVLRSLASDQADAYAEEVRVLRRRVATLEAALRAADAQVHRSVSDQPPLTSVDFVPVVAEPVVPSEFGVAQVPAVVQISAEDAARQITVGAAESAESSTECGGDEIVSSPTTGFAEVWTDDEDTFEEKFAARAFFEQSTDDQPSRRWFLGSN